MGSQASDTAIVQKNSDSSDISVRVFVCPMEQRHIAQVCQIEKLCFSSPWNEAMMTGELKNPLSRYIVLLNRKKPEEVIAYAGYWNILDEGHITNVAVHPQWRQQKAGRYLMQQMMALAQAEGITAMTLEVRESNQIARRLYETLGFQEEGIRKKYYEDNQEDAIIMWYRQEKTEE